MTKEEIIEAISNNKLMPFIQPEQLNRIVDFVIENYKPSLPSDLDDAAKEHVIRTLGEDVVWDENARFALLDFKAGAEWMQNRKFLEVLENEPLDSAARKVFEDWIPTEVLTIDGVNGGIPLYNQGALIMMFKAGAEWMAGQGYADEVKYSDLEDRKYVFVPYEEFNPGDKVIVQIRKKNDL